jgi:hypothetical protein
VDVGFGAHPLRHVAKFKRHPRARVFAATFPSCSDLKPVSGAQAIAAPRNGRREGGPYWCSVQRLISSS